jgi:actin-like ATPase involved in cell morphogenesis
MSVVKKQHIANNVLRRGNPYAVNLKADHERCLEEARVRQQMEERQRKQEEKMRERIRRQIVQAAINRLAGGGSLIRKIDRAISEATGLPVFVAEDPLCAVVNGTGKILANSSRWSGRD